MFEIIGLILFIVICGIGIYLIATWGDGAKKRKQKVLSIIVSSRITSVADISKSTKIKEEKLIPVIQSLIAHANEDWSPFNGVELLRGAQLDLNKMEIVLPIKNEPWTCSYCRTSNDGKEIICSSCKASK